MIVSPDRATDWYIQNYPCVLRFSFLVVLPKPFLVSPTVSCIFFPSSFLPCIFFSNHVQRNINVRIYLYPFKNVNNRQKRRRSSLAFYHCLLVDEPTLVTGCIPSMVSGMMICLLLLLHG